MTIAIMQPYLFPYVGYFQLLVAADKFLIYDDVQFIKGGWINRNRLLINGEPFLFTVPLDAPSPNRNICDIGLGANPHWRAKLLQTIGQGYRRASQFEQVFHLIEQIFSAANETIVDLVHVSILHICEYLDIKTIIIPSSACYGNQHLHGQERILEICRVEGATDYINAKGGRALYDRDVFGHHGVRLHFLEPTLRPYRQVGRKPFIHSLSIIDVLMNNSKDEVNEMLRNYQLT